MIFTLFWKLSLFLIVVTFLQFTHCWNLNAHTVDGGKFKWIDYIIFFLYHISLKMKVLRLIPENFL